LDGSNNTIFNNTLLNIYQNGICLTYLNNSLVRNNKILLKKTSNNIYLDLIGIKIDYTNYCNVLNNLIPDFNDYGFYVKGSNLNIIFNNSIQNSETCGIYLVESDNNSIAGNFITYTGNCIKESNCYGNIYNNNMCHKIPGIIFGYNIWFIVGVVILTSTMILKKQSLYYKKRNKIIQNAY